MCMFSAPFNVHTFRTHKHKHTHTYTHIYIYTPTRTPLSQISKINLLYMRVSTLSFLSFFSFFFFLSRLARGTFHFYVYSTDTFKPPHHSPFPHSLLPRGGGRGWR